MKLLFLHGFCESSEIWQESVDQLDMQGSILAPDLPGFGVKGTESCNSLQSVAAQIMSEVDGDPLFIVGHSLGGYVALEILNSFEDRVAGICLFHSTAAADSSEKKENRNKTIEFIRNHGKQPFLDQFVPSLMSRESALRNKALIPMMERIGLGGSESTICTYSEWMRDRPDFRSLLKQSDIPKFYIFGKNDGFLDYQKMIIEFEAESIRCIQTIHESIFVTGFKIENLGTEPLESINKMIKRYAV